MKRFGTGLSLSFGLVCFGACDPDSSAPVNTGPPVQMHAKEFTCFVFEWSAKPDGAETLIVDASGRAVYFKLWHEEPTGTAEEFSIPPQTLETLTQKVQEAISSAREQTKKTNRIEDEIILRAQLWTPSDYWRTDCGEDCPDGVKDLEDFLQKDVLALPRKDAVSVAADQYANVWSQLYSEDFSVSKPAPRIGDVLSSISEGAP